MDQVFKLKFSGLSNFMYSNRCAKFHQNLEMVTRGPAVNLACNDPILVNLCVRWPLMVKYILWIFLVSLLPACKPKNLFVDTCQMVREDLNYY